MKATALLVVTLALHAGAANGEPVSDSVRAQVEKAVRQAVADYVAAVKAQDLPKILSFWGDFDDFVHAGDGRVFGDHEKWTTWIKNNLPDRYLYWINTDIHVAVLASDAAAYTMNFENSFVKDGETREVTGSWTYVLRKSDLGWQVVHSNGHHIGLSYDE